MTRWRRIDRTRVRRGVAYPERVRGDGDGWVVSDDRRALLGPARRGRSAAARAPAGRQPRRAAAAPGAVESSGRHLGAAGRRPRQPRDRRAGRRPRGARGGRAVRRAAARCAPPSSPPRSSARAAPRGPTPPSSPTRPSCWTPCPTGRAPSCAGCAEDEVADLPLHPGFAASWERLRITAMCPTHECRLAAAHRGDRRRLRLVPPGQSPQSAPR